MTTQLSTNVLRPTRAELSQLTSAITHALNVFVNSRETKLVFSYPSRTRLEQLHGTWGDRWVGDVCEFEISRGTGSSGSRTYCLDHIKVHSEWGTKRITYLVLNHLKYEKSVDTIGVKTTQAWLVRILKSLTFTNTSSNDYVWCRSRRCST